MSADSRLPDSELRMVFTTTLLAALAISALVQEDLPQQRGQRGQRLPAGVYRDRVEPHWFANDAKFWYRNLLKNGTREFVLVDAEKGKRGPAFDHAKLATALSKAANEKYETDRLP